MIECYNIYSMKKFWLINSAIFTVLILIFGFENFPAYSKVPLYIFFFAFYDTIAVPIFIASFIGIMAGWSYAMFYMAHKKEMEEDSDFYE